MHEFHSAGVQRNAAVGVRALCAVLEVALDGASYSRQLATYLVVSACLEFYLHKCVVLGTAQCAVVENGVLALFGLLFIGKALVHLLVAHNPM